MLIAEVTAKTLAAKAPLAWARACALPLSRVRGRRDAGPRSSSTCVAELLLRPLGDARAHAAGARSVRAGVPLARRRRLGAGRGRRARAPPDPPRVRVLRQERRPGDDAARSDLRAVVRPADAARSSRRSRRAASRACRSTRSRSTTCAASSTRRISCARPRGAAQQAARRAAARAAVRAAHDAGQAAVPDVQAEEGPHGDRRQRVRQGARPRDDGRSARADLRRAARRARRAAGVDARDQGAARRSRRRASQTGPVPKQDARQRAECRGPTHPTAVRRRRATDSDPRVRPDSDAAIDARRAISDVSRRGSTPVDGLDPPIRRRVADPSDRRGHAAGDRYRRARADAGAQAS